MGKTIRKRIWNLKGGEKMLKKEKYFEIVELYGELELLLLEAKTYNVDNLEEQNLVRQKLNTSIMEYLEKDGRKDILQFMEYYV